MLIWIVSKNYIEAKAQRPTIWKPRT